MIVAQITAEKAEELQGKEFYKGQYYNPVELSIGWVISLVEAQYLTVEDVVEFVDYEPEYVSEI